MSYSIAEAMDVDVTYGWLISSVTIDSGAEEAGLNGGDEQFIINNEYVVIGGDIIVAIDDNKIINGDELLSYLEEYTKPDQIIIVTIIRNNQQIDIPVEVGTRPDVI